MIALKISYGRKILINCNTLFVTEVTDIPRNDNLICHCQLFIAEVRTLLVEEKLIELWQINFSLFLC